MLSDSQNASIHQLFESQVEQTPDNVAVVFKGEQLTYRELNHRANRIAHYLKDQGVEPEVLVGICVERSLEMIVGILGILKAGGAYLPLDSEYPQERLAFMLEEAQMPILLTQKQLVSAFPKHGAKVVYLDGDSEEFSRESEENTVSGVTTDNLAYVIYTSGSTGKPKGVLVTHKGLCNLAKAQLKLFNVQPSSRVLQFASSNFDASVWEILMALSVGATLCLGTRDSLLPGPALIKQLREQAITIVTLPPSVLAILPPDVLPALQTIIVAGEACSPDLVARWAPGRRFFNAYGPTEATVCATVAECTNNREKPTIGYPIPNVQVYLLDNQLKQVPVGVPGELCIGGIGLARGYLNRPELTDERFIPNPFSNKLEERLYKTGDLACYLLDGNIEFLGRIDNQVKVRGFRIEPGEIEAVLWQHSGVREAVVMVPENASGNKRLVAYVVSSLEPAPSTSELRRFLKEKLPDYMVPSVFMMLDTLPLTPNGKVDRCALLLLALNDTQRELEEAFVAPRTPIEEQLAGIWAKILGVEKVGINDNFLELGGHSLLAAQLLLRLQEAFDIEMPVRYLYESPTVKGLAQIIEALQGESPGAIFTSTTIDLKAEAVLDAEIYPRKTYLYDVSPPRHILLTGATGFVGAFLLYELLQRTQAKIHCLVRANNPDEGLKRLQNTLEQYSLWEPSLSSKIVIIPGDLAQPLFGLSDEQFNSLGEELDTIYHSGAEVNFVKPYSSLKATNVLGTQEILRLACQGKVKPVHYISTSAVFSTIGYFTGLKVNREEDDIAHSESYLYSDMSYSQSKWVAEKLVWIAKSRGLPVTIFRPGFVLGHSQTGVSNLNDFMARLIKGCIQMGSFPDLDTTEYFIPVDYASRAIVHLSRKKESQGKAFHVVNPQHIPLVDFFELIRSFGYPMKKLPYTRWKDELISHTRNSLENALYPLLPMLIESVNEERMTIPELHQKNPYYDSQNMILGLADTSIFCPLVEAKLLDTYFSYFIRSEFLKPPQLGEKITKTLSANWENA
jgi:amino acid adenylation domain-containing protein/thioester reductase-like protein